jgi:hypothetical protein
MWYKIIIIWFSFLILIFGRIYWINRKKKSVIIFKDNKANNVLRNVKTSSHFHPLYPRPKGRGFTGLTDNKKKTLLGLFFSYNLNAIIWPSIRVSGTIGIQINKTFLF